MESEFDSSSNEKTFVIALIHRANGNLGSLFGLRDAVSPKFYPLILDAMGAIGRDREGLARLLLPKPLSWEELEAISTNFLNDRLILSMWILYHYFEFPIEWSKIWKQGILDNNPAISELASTDRDKFYCPLLSIRCCLDGGRKCPCSPCLPSQFPFPREALYFYSHLDKEGIALAGTGGVRLCPKIFAYWLCQAPEVEEFDPIGIASGDEPLNLDINTILEILLEQNRVDLFAYVLRRSDEPLNYWAGRLLKDRPQQLDLWLPWFAARIPLPIPIDLNRNATVTVFEKLDIFLPQNQLNSFHFSTVHEENLLRRLINQNGLDWALAHIIFSPHELLDYLSMEQIEELLRRGLFEFWELHIDIIVRCVHSLQLPKPSYSTVSRAFAKFAQLALRTNQPDYFLFEAKSEQVIIMTQLCRFLVMPDPTLPSQEADGYVSLLSALISRDPGLEDICHNLLLDVEKFSLHERYHIYVPAWKQLNISADKILDDSYGHRLSFFKSWLAFWPIELQMKEFALAEVSSGKVGSVADFADILDITTISKLRGDCIRRKNTDVKPEGWQTRSDDAILRLIKLCPRTGYWKRTETDLEFIRFLDEE